MSDIIYNNVIRVKEMKTEREEMTVDIYESADCVRDHDFQTKTNTLQPPQHTGSDSVKSRSSRAAVVCLVLLCILLLTAVIVLCVYILTNNTNYTQETHRLLTKITNLTEDKDGLQTKITNLTQEKDELIMNRKKLINQLSFLGKEDEWIYHQFSFYYMSNETKNWDESRRYCTEKGADLIVINNREEQNFVMKITNKREFWIGVTDSDEEGIWKWVDGSTLTSGFWASDEPNGGRRENCVVTYVAHRPDLIGWLDVKCNDFFKSICEKSILPLIQRGTS